MPLKKVFGSAESKDILISFLNAMNEFNHQRVIIEMQVLNHEGLEKRILYNAAKNTPFS